MSAKKVRLADVNWCKDYVIAIRPLLLADTVTVGGDLTRFDQPKRVKSIFQQYKPSIMTVTAHAKRFIMTHQKLRKLVFFSCLQKESVIVRLS